MDTFIELIDELAEDRGYETELGINRVVIGGRSAGEYVNRYEFISYDGRIILSIIFFLYPIQEDMEQTLLRNNVYDLTEFAEGMFNTRFNFELPDVDGGHITIASIPQTDINTIFQNYSFEGDDFEQADRMLDVLEYLENEFYRDCKIAGFELSKSLNY